MPENQAWREDISAAVNRLRNRFLFLFIFLVAALVVVTLALSRADGQFVELVQQLKEERYNACVQRVSDISLYNSKLTATSPPGYLPTFPVPHCPPRPAP